MSPENSTAAQADWSRATSRSYDAAGHSDLDQPSDSIRLCPVDKDSFQSTTCSDQLKALSEPLRLRIIDLLRHGEMTVGDIAEFLETELVTVSHHLKILKHARLVEVERDGRYMVYRLRKDLLTKGRGRSREYLDLGCCRLEVPSTDNDPDQV